MITHNQMGDLTDDFIREPIVIMAADHADKLVCRLCGANYVSSGKHDSGFCRKCLREMDEENAMLVGGPLDGQKAHP